MTYKIRILSIIIAIFSINTFGQTTTINSVYVNNQTTVTNCNLIDIGTTISNNLTFYFTLSKPTAQANMAGTVKIYLANSISGNYTIGGEYIVQPSSWISNGQGQTTVTGTVSCNFNSSAIQVTGSSVTIGFTIGSNNPIYNSCNYPLKKTQLPEFNLSPTNVSIPCGTAQATTFTVANVYSSPGTLTYSWNAYGWIRNGSVVNSPFTTTTNTITLTPASATSLPSTVSVQTNLNSVSQGTKNCNVSRPAFTSTATISGNNLCSSSITYTISPATQTVNSWSLSNNTVATISNPTASSVTLTPNGGNGQVTLNANVTNSCGQTGVISKILNIGAPTFPSNSYINGATNVGLNQYVNFSYSGSNPTGGNSTYWSIDAPVNDNNIACNWQIISGQGTNSILVKTSCQNSTAVIRLNSNNSCGTSYRYLYVSANQGVPCNSNVANRRTSSGNYESVIPIPCNGTDPNARVNNSNINSAALYDLSGNKIKDYKSNDYDVGDVEKGIYILKVEADNQVITTKIVVD